MKKALIIILHFALFLLAYTSWLWLAWEIIALLAVAHNVMLETCNGCFLSHSQFGDKENNNTRFYEWCIGKLGIKNYNREKLNVFMRYWVPLILILLGIIVQEMFELNIWISI